LDQIVDRIASVGLSMAACRVLAASGSRRRVLLVASLANLPGGRGREVGYGDLTAGQFLWFFACSDERNDDEEMECDSVQ